METLLVRDLAVILISAGIFTIISKFFRQPSVLGYIIAGFLVGPSISFFPGISSTEAVEQWSEIGVIFLMFALGLEFSFKKLLKVGSGALITAGTKFVAVFILGFIAGMAMHWTTMESIFLAGLLSMSSTAVVIKSFDEMGLKNKSYAGNVFGTLVVEDLIAILLMVMLSTMAVSNDFEGGAMLLNLGKLVFFIVLWFIIGIYAIPTLLKASRRYLNDEILLVVSVGLCFGMVVFATAVGFSSALGAFVMGSILAETVEEEHIIKIVSPLKDLFSAIFFVSVGMMVSPSAIAEHWVIILIITLLVYLTHILSAGAGALLARKGLEDAVHTGFSLAQLGEFGFIIAGVGVSLGVMRDFIYPVIISVSVITTFTTPYMIKLAGPAYRFLQRKLPAKLLERLEPDDQGKTSREERNDWIQLLRLVALRFAMYAVVLIAIVIASRKFLLPLLLRVTPEYGHLAYFLVTVLLMLPLLFGLAVSGSGRSESAMRLYREKPGNIVPLIGLMLLRIFVSIGVLVSFIVKEYDIPWWAVTLLVIGLSAVFVMYLFRSGKHNKRYSRIEQRFFSNFNEKEMEQMKRSPVSAQLATKLNGYDVHAEEIVLSPDFSYAGKSLRNVPLRSVSGVSVLKIRRGTRSIMLPGADEMLFPGDVLVAVGTSAQLEECRKFISEAVVSAPEGHDREFRLYREVVSEDNRLCGRSIRDFRKAGDRETVVAILRGEDFITNPGVDLTISEGDVVWLADA